jgi:DNA-binding NarL/FixJ family response regulator
MTPIRIVVVDDHALFRAGLISLLSQMPGFEIVGQGGNGLEAIEIVGQTNPDILLLDVNMPAMNGVETVKALRQKTACRILMLTISKQQEDLLGAIRAGADGYLLKNAEPEELRKAILLTLEGKATLSPEVTSQILGVLRQPKTNLEISRREKEVLQGLAQGKTNSQIAAELVISGNTVKTHVRNIMEKLGASNRAETVRLAIQKGIID